MPEHTHIYLTYIFIILGDSGGGLTLIQSIVMVKLNSKMLLFFFSQISYIQEGKAFRISCQKKKKKGVTRPTAPLSAAEAVSRYSLICS